MSHRARADLLPRIERADARQQIAERENTLHHRFRHSECIGNVRDAAPLANQPRVGDPRSEEHTSELQSLMRISYAVFCLKKKITTIKPEKYTQTTHKKTLRNDDKRLHIEEV